MLELALLALLELAFWGGIIALIVLGFIVGPHLLAFIGLGFFGIMVINYLFEYSSGSSSGCYVQMQNLDLTENCYVQMQNLDLTEIYNGTSGRVPTSISVKRPELEPLSQGSGRRNVPK